MTSYWIGIKAIDTVRKMLIVDGLNVASLAMTELRLFYASIQRTELIDGSYYPLNQSLIQNIEERPSLYTFLFQNITNLKLLDYYSACNRLDSTPYRKDYKLIQELDIDNIGNGTYVLSKAQFAEIVGDFHREAKYKKDSKGNPRIQSLCMNLCSVHTRSGLYVLAYKKLLLDVQNHALRQSDEVTVCQEFTVNGTKLSIGYFLDGEELEWLEDFEANAEQIKDAITVNHSEYGGVDDMPYVMAIAHDYKVDLETEYEAILEMYESDKVTYPIRAFFGDLTAKPRRTKEYPVALYNNRVNLDQLLAIHHGMKYPILYVQGPPGSGKTNTILNMVTTAFFNEKTVLISSYNNHPMDEIYGKLSKLKYRNNTIPFPIIRLGNKKSIKKAVVHIRALYEKTASMKVFDAALARKHNEEQNRARALSNLLHRYENRVELIERKEMIQTMLSSTSNLPFMMDLQGTQLHQINVQLSEIGEIQDGDVYPLLAQDRDAFLQYLNYTSAKYIKRLSEPKYKDLLDIIYLEDIEAAAAALVKYLSVDENMRKFLRIFPIIVTTNISAHKLGEPKQYFDLVIMDEASQCNTAVALLPILRGNQLMLVGDPQQLRPVILLDEKSNTILKRRYGISDAYDYCSKSVYQTFLAADAVSDEVLLSYHYRCHPKIIAFNNRKYYNKKLHVKTKAKNEDPLAFMHCPGDAVDIKNTSDSEAQSIVQYIQAHPGKSVGVITPFVNQKEKIQTVLRENGITNVDCGTVHAFQGDEKQEIIFSLALSEKTGAKTYDWLKNNKELINVATSRAQEKLIIVGDQTQLDRLHGANTEDDLYELCNYVRSNGTTEVRPRIAASRALGIKPYSTETETAFLQNLNHAIGAMMITRAKYIVQKEVAISQVFSTTSEINDLFYTGRFDYVVYEKSGQLLYPVFAIELDGNEHFEDERVKERDRKKQEICEKQNFQLIRVPNNYARRYNYVKDILSGFFKNAGR